MRRVDYAYSSRQRYFSCQLTPYLTAENVDFALEETYCPDVHDVIPPDSDAIYRKELTQRALGGLSAEEGRNGA